jgi:class 3 adenylate cyclase
MHLAERFDPEQWFRIVEDFFQVVADGVHRFEGTVLLLRSGRSSPPFNA